MRAVLREWDTSDHLVSQLRVLSEGGGAPEWMTECSGIFEQLLDQMAVRVFAQFARGELVDVETCSRYRHSASRWVGGAHLRDLSSAVPCRRPSRRAEKWLELGPCV